ncbi:CotH kinase family protein [Geomicrobium sp. JCM 19039]|uniref:CotH kinase family protein n=1 Tax=Geomicrobium sp. JCM 19039 TaxID=1460636 RepID=UPI00045F481E|nr:CotH kinase family protein [Geomicrobium sp. JCM 19039]GAK11614.1 membrane protein [Geomicrobium sp. JCM 19039]
MYDTDSGFGLPATGHTFAHNTLHWATEGAPEWSTSLFISLLDNPSFRDEFIQRFAHYTNTVFSDNRVLSTIEEMQAELEPEMQAHIDRWGEPHRSKSGSCMSNV